MKSQVVINTEGEIIDVDGDNPGSLHDKKIFDESKIISIIPRDIDIMGDSGYQGIKDDFPRAKIPIKKKCGGQSLNKIQKRHNRKISRERVIVEHTIRKMKVFKILSEKYRGKRNKHGDIVRTISYFINVQSGFGF
jgi:hypothetical protein